MIAWIRQASKPLLWFVVVIVVITFAFWGDFTPTGRVTGSTVGVIDGVPLDAKDYQASLREATLGYFLSEGRMPPPGEDGEKIVQNLAWHRLLLLNQADKMKIETPKQEVEKSILRFPPFVTDGNFNPATFDRFRRILLPSIGISYRDFENMMRNDLRINRAIDALCLGVLIDEAKVDEQIMRDYGENNFLILNLPLDARASDIHVTDEILRSIYDSRSAQLLEPEKRSFILAEFPFEKDNTLSLQHARDRAVNFTVSLVDEEGNTIEDFSGAAKRAAAQTRDLQSVTSDALDENFPDLPAILAEGFKLTKENPDSNPIQGDSAFYVLRFISADERKPLPYDQVKQQIEEEYRNRQALSRGFVAARRLREKIFAELGKGNDIVKLATDKGLTMEEITSFVPSEAMATGEPEQYNLASIIGSLKPGELSQPQSFRKGVAFFYLKSRTEPQDKEKYRADVKERLHQQNKNTLLAEWLAHSLRNGSELKIK